MNNSTTGKSISYTSHYENYGFAQQGWQCPICKKILAPFMTYCPFHNEENNKWSVTSAIEEVEDDK